MKGLLGLIGNASYMLSVPRRDPRFLSYVVLVEIFEGDIESQNL